MTPEYTDNRDHHSHLNTSVIVSKQVLLSKLSRFKQTSWGYVTSVSQKQCQQGQLPPAGTQQQTLLGSPKTGSEPGAP